MYICTLDVYLIFFSLKTNMKMWTYCRRYAILFSFSQIPFKTNFLSNKLTSQLLLSYFLFTLQILSLIFIPTCSGKHHQWPSSCFCLRGFFLYNRVSFLLLRKFLWFYCVMRPWNIWTNQYLGGEAAASPSLLWVTRATYQYIQERETETERQLCAGTIQTSPVRGN